MRKKTKNREAKIPKSAIRIPLTIGICGHRELATPENEVRDELDRVWAFLRRKFPNTPFVVLDSLAEGADRLVLKTLPRNIPYVAVLPFAAERFKEDFADDRSRAEFDELLAGAARTVVAGERPRDYSAASRYVVEHSDLLLALWDMESDLRNCRSGGVPPLGGTWDSVNLALASGTTGFPDERRPVEIVHVPVRRRNGADAAASAPTRFRILKPGTECIPEVIRPECWLPAEEWILCDRLNRKCRRSAKETPRMSEFTGGVNVKEIRTDVARFAFFSGLASRVRRRQKREFAVIYAAAILLGVALLVCQKCGIGLPAKIPLRPYALFLACTWLYFKWYLAKQERSDWHLLSRSIAEGLRIGIFWRLWGLPDPVADSFPEGTRYLIRIFRNWELLSVPPRLDMSARVLQCWILRQRRWLEQRIAAARRKDRWCRGIRWGVLIAAALAAGICLLLQRDTPSPLPALSWKEIALGTFAAGMLLSSCAEFFRQKKAWLRLADFYEVSHRNFDYAARNYAHFSPEERAEAVRKLGIRALQENSKWQGLRRELRQ